MSELITHGFDGQITTATAAVNQAAFYIWVDIREISIAVTHAGANLMKALITDILSLKWCSWVLIVGKSCP